MLESLKRVGQGLGAGVQRALSNLAEGWRELRSRSGRALTPFHVRQEEADLVAVDRFPRWGLLSSEIYENAHEVVVRVEVPGLDGKDIEVTAEDGMLYIRGEKHRSREEDTGRYYLAECAYGWFERALPLPYDVDTSRATARYRNGVLTVRLPKTNPARRITVH